MKLWVEEENFCGGNVSFFYPETNTRPRVCCVQVMLPMKAADEFVSRWWGLELEMD